MPEQHWRDALRAAIAERSHSQVQADDLTRALQPHFEAAYARGLIAGRSQAGYTTRRKRTEDPCPTAAPSAGTPSPASSTEGDE